jgi:hypothetical protein
MPKAIQNATNVLVLGARLYRELALSAMTLLPGRHED